MPIYEFRCGECDHTFEELVLPKSGTTLAAQVLEIEGSPCRNPVCDSPRVVLVISPTSRRGPVPSAGGCAPTGGS